MSISNKYKFQDENEKIFNSPYTDWWDPDGSFKALHSINPCRIEYVINTLKKNKLIKYKSNSNNKILKDLKILDVGCGGGLLCEPLTRLGGNVLGIDKAPNAIKIAKSHAKKMNLKIQYQCKKIEEISNSKFDVIIASEIIEHLEKLIDEVTEKYEPPTEFVIPGGSEISARLDLARAVTRRAERAVLTVVAEDSQILPYLNRLADLLWVMARWQEEISIASRSIRSSD